MVEKSQYEATYGNESDLGNYISIHCLNNPLRQSFIWQFSQGKRREKKDYNYNNQNDNFLVNDSASLGLFMTVTNPLATIMLLIYLVINGGTSMQNDCDSSVVEALSKEFESDIENGKIEKGKHMEMIIDLYDCAATDPQTQWIRLFSDWAETVHIWLKDESESQSNKDKDKEKKTARGKKKKKMRQKRHKQQQTTQSRKRR